MAERVSLLTNLVLTLSHELQSTRALVADLQVRSAAAPTQQSPVFVFGRDRSRSNSFSGAAASACLQQQAAGGRVSQLKRGFDTDGRDSDSRAKAQRGATGARDGLPPPVVPRPPP